MKQRKPYNKVEERAKETVILSSLCLVCFLIAFIAMGVAYARGAWF
ncbi:hypothetical protein JDFnp1_4 [Fusobacterium phage JD-Fnp1]|nr:hypothetical protein JDFnp1_4 [Fusobacterium phage JD-Fnp1]